MTTDTDRLTIVLSDRSPINIDKAQWPIIAHGHYFGHDGDAGLECRANRKTRINIKVRQHADGRSIVNGTYTFETNWEKERSRAVKVGYLLEPGADLVAAIRHVGAELAAADVDGKILYDVMGEAISELPPQEV